MRKIYWFKKTAILVLILFVFDNFFIPVYPVEAKAKKIYVAEPTQIFGTWSNMSRALNRDLNNNADIAKFNNLNSATPFSEKPIYESENKQNEQKKQEQAPAELPVIFTTTTNQTTSTTSSSEVVPIPETSSQAQPSPPVDTSQVAPEIPAIVPEVSPSVETAPPSATTPEPPPTSEPPPTPEPSALLKNIFYDFFAILIPPANAKDEEVKDDKIEKEKKSPINDFVDTSTLGIDIFSAPFTVNKTTTNNLLASSTELITSEIPKETISTSSLLESFQTISSAPIDTSTTASSTINQINTSTESIFQGGELPASINGPPNQKEFILSDFIFRDDVSLFKGNTLFQSVNLGLSFAANSYPGQSIYVQYQKNKDWVVVAEIKLDVSHSNNKNNDFYFISLPSTIRLKEIEQLKIKISFNPLSGQEQANIYLDAVWIEAAKSGRRLEKNDNNSQVKLISPRKDFMAGEELFFEFEYSQSPPGWFDRAKTSASNIIDIVTQNDNKQKNKEYALASAVYQENGSPVQSFAPNVVFEEGNKFLLKMKPTARGMTTGYYKIRTHLYVNNDIITSEESFTIGVLAINSNKSIYAPGETSFLQMAALTEEGRTICDADLSLDVVDPNNVTTTPAIVASGLCGNDNIVSVPDYYSNYTVSTPGVYTMRLRDIDREYEVFDKFEVRNNVSVDISRGGPTRIFPPANYDMQIKFKVLSDVAGSVTERIPLSFFINNISMVSLGASTGVNSVVNTIESGNEKLLTWNIDWHQGEEYLLTYNFKAPDISPYLYLLGPIQITSEKNENDNNNALKSNQDRDIFFQETRQWQIAADALDYSDPNGDGTVQCEATPAGTHFNTLDDAIRQPTTPDTADYISCGVNQYDMFQMTNISNVQETSAIEVWAYHNDGGDNVQWDVSLWNDSETTQYGSAQSIANSTTTVWGSTSFSVALSQTQLDGLRIKFNNTKISGADATSTIYATYTNITFAPENNTPSISNLSLNSGADISLANNTSTVVIATALATDLDGYSDISSARGVIYRSGVNGEQNCVPDENNCYVIDSCQLANCVGNNCDVACVAAIQYYAEPTTTSTPWSGEYWRGWIQVTDSQALNNSAFTASGSPQMLSLLSFSSSPIINYGSNLLAGQPGTVLDVPLTITSTGNCSLDVKIFGTDLTSASSTIAAGKQRYSLSQGASYALGIPLATSSNQTLDLDLPKTTSSYANTFDNIWFGIETPIGIPAGSYVGAVTLQAVINTPPWP